MIIRKANIRDGVPIHALLTDGAKKGELLSRSLSEIYDNIRDYFVVQNDDNEIVGVCALHICWEDLAEIRSLMVRSDKRGMGLGADLLRNCMEESRSIGVNRAFALTYQVEFFTRHGFKVVDKGELPHKIWSDCVRCSKFPNCDEVAMIRTL